MVASSAAAVLEPAPEIAFLPDLREQRLRETLSPRELGAVGESVDLGALDARVVALCREGGPLRAVLARIASSVVFSRSWERLGYARLSDYAAERLGVSARSVQSLGRVGHRLRRSPRLETALVSGELAWTKVRLLAPLPTSEDLGSWIGYARSVTAAQLSKSVRAVDGASIEGNALDERPRGKLFSVRCSPAVRRQWAYATKVAARVAEQRLSVSEAAEVIAAEVLSAVPLDDDADEGCGDEGTSWGSAAEEAAEADSESAQPEMPRGRLPWRVRTDEAGSHRVGRGGEGTSAPPRGHTPSPPIRSAASESRLR